MFVVISSADKNRKPSRIAVETVSEYREFIPGAGEQKNDVKTIIIFKKDENKKDLHSSNTIEELDAKFNETLSHNNR